MTRIWREIKWQISSRVAIDWLGEESGKRPVLSKAVLPPWMRCLEVWNNNLTCKPWVPVAAAVVQVISDRWGGNGNQCGKQEGASGGRRHRLHGKHPHWSQGGPVTWTAWGGEPSWPHSKKWEWVGEDVLHLGETLSWRLETGPVRFFSNWSYSDKDEINIATGKSSQVITPLHFFQRITSFRISSTSLSTSTST